MRWLSTLIQSISAGVEGLEHICYRWRLRLRDLRVRLDPALRQTEPALVVRARVEALTTILECANCGPNA